MGQKALSVPSINVNNITYSIVPNSFSYEPGYGEINVRSASAGGGISESIHTEDAETKIGMMKWEMYVTDLSRAAVASWKKLTALNFIAATQTGSAALSLSFASMSNNPTFEATADGKVEVEFRGDGMPDTI